MTTTTTLTDKAWRALRRLALAACLAPLAWPAAQAQTPAQTLVERGEYLARAGDCISCHTAQGGITEDACVRENAGT